MKLTKWKKTKLMLNLNTFLIIILIVFANACNQTSTPINKEKPSELVNESDGKYFSPLSLPITNMPSRIIAKIENGFFEGADFSDTIYNIHAYIDYENNIIKIAVPVLSSDEITIFEGQNGSTRVVDIQVSVNPDQQPFDAISYFEVPYKKEDQLLLRLFSINGQANILFEKTIENDYVFNSDIVDYSLVSNNSSLSTYNLPNHFKQFYENDTCFFINKIDAINDAVYQFELFDFVDYEQEISSITYEVDGNYLLINIVIDENRDIAYDETKLAYLKFEIDADSYERTDKIKIEKQTSSRKVRKTIAKSVNKED